MKKLLTIALLAVSTVGMAQKPKKQKCVWEEGGGMMIIGGNKSDTVTNYYTHKFKDSISFKISVESCNCNFYISDIDHKQKPCEGLIRHYLETSHWKLEKSVTLKGKDTISTEKPHWVTNFSSFSTIDGVFTIKGKEVYPQSLHYKNKRVLTINNY